MSLGEYVKLARPGLRSVMKELGGLFLHHLGLNVLVCLKQGRALLHQCYWYLQYFGGTSWSSGGFFTIPLFPPILHLYSTSDPADSVPTSPMTPPNPHFRIQPSFYLPPPSPQSPYLSPPNLPSPYLPPPSPPSPSIPDAVQPAVVVPAAAQLAVVVCSRTSRRPAPAAAVAHPPPTCRRLAAV